MVISIGTGCGLILILLGAVPGLFARLYELCSEGVDTCAAALELPRHHVCRDPVKQPAWLIPAGTLLIAFTVVAALLP